MNQQLPRAVPALQSALTSAGRGLRHGTHRARPPLRCAACARTRQSTSGTAKHTLKHAAGGTFRTSQEEQLAPPDPWSQAQPCRSAPSSRSPRLGVIRAARAESSSGGGARCGGRARLETAPPQPLLESCRAWPLPATLADRGGSRVSAPLSGAPFTSASGSRARDEPPRVPGALGGIKSTRGRPRNGGCRIEAVALQRWFGSTSVQKRSTSPWLIH